MNPHKTVPCPWCKAEAGAGCVDTYGYAFKPGIHMARYYAAQQVENRKGA